MTKSSLCKAFVLLIAIACSARCWSQQSFSYTSDLKGVKTPGFYKVVLTPAIVARCKEGVTDIRIFDERSRQVPYILKSDRQKFEESSFINLEVVSIKKESDKQTHVILKNSTGRIISELLLFIKNTDANRTVTLSGSDDSLRWYVIKEDISLSNFFDPGSDYFIQSLHFPGSSYKYFKIIINGKDLLPVNITKAGLYQNQSRTGGYTVLPAPSIKRGEFPGKQSFVALDFDEQYEVNKLELWISGAKFYRRDVIITKKTEYSNEPVGNFTLSADAATFPVNVKSNQLTIIIRNGDNPPLMVDSVKAYQLNKYLLAYLEPDHKYRLYFGDVNVGAPDYDLGFFKDSIKHNAPEILAGPVLQNEEAKVVSKRSEKSKAMLWIIIGSVLALLLVVTLQMAKEIGKNKKV